jgi:hypothetical protein
MANGSVAMVMVVQRLKSNQKYMKLIQKVIEYVK